MPVHAPRVSTKCQCATPNTASNSFPEPQSQSQKRSSDKQSAENVKHDKKYLTHFFPKLTKEWPCILASSKSHHEFHCTVCKRTVSCAKQGVCDVKIHLESQLQIQNAKNMKTQTTLFQSCVSQQNTQEKV